MAKQKNNRVFASGAQRDANIDKPFIHNLRGYTRQRFGYLMTAGARKYGDSNFLKGMPSEVYLESLDRHLAAYLEGDRTEDHLAAIIFGAQGCMLNEQKEGITAKHYYNMKTTTKKKSTKTRRTAKSTRKTTKRK